MSSGSGSARSDPMTFSHAIDFAFDLALDAAVAIDFVHDVRGSLKHVDFIRDVRVQSGSPALVEATIPVNAALFGQRQLPFKSQLVRTPKGALLRVWRYPMRSPAGSRSLVKRWLPLACRGAWSRTGLRLPSISTCRPQRSGAGAP